MNSPQDGVVVDLSGKKNGRGAYLCDQVVCWDNARWHYDMELRLDSLFEVKKESVA